jgi:alpha-D-ribose 1-methylphosphonate 5-triphosphate synthase subunit PhnG
MRPAIQHAKAPAGNRSRFHAIVKNPRHARFTLATKPPNRPAMIADPRPPAESARRTTLAILARANRQELADAWERLSPQPTFETVRRPELGLMMVRGRIGGGGAPFNLGEVTVTRCAVVMESGEVGYGNVLGRDAGRAELVARFDALAQSNRYRDYVEKSLLDPVAERARRDDDAARRETAATRVNFFTMVRGEDE